MGTNVDETEHTLQTRQFFDAAASGWTARYAQDAAVAARLARFRDAVQARLSPPASILDFGCGSGDIALHLAPDGYRLTGFDLSTPMIEQARRADTGRRVVWIVRGEHGDTLPFDDAGFDAVVTSSVLEYLPALDATLREFARILRPGGWLIATVPDIRDPHRRREQWFQTALALPGVATLARRSRWREGAHYLQISINRMTGAVWQERLQASGFKPEAWPESTGPLLMLVAQRHERQ